MSIGGITDIKPDPEADAVYIQLRDLPYAFGRDLDDSRRIDYSADSKPIGIELLNVSMGVHLRDLPEQGAIGRLLQAHGIKLLV
ncbi:MAG: DUF2283 domain-containing protein [Dehalococcoidia bacterium]